MTELLAWTFAAILAVAGVAIIRARRTQTAHGETIRVISSKYLGGKRYLSLVEVDGERLLVGLGGDNVTLVARLESPADTGDLAEPA
jgi:flagellar biogenesis protein FliO